MGKYRSLDFGDGDEIMIYDSELSDEGPIKSSIASIAQREPDNDEEKKQSSLSSLSLSSLSRPKSKRRTTRVSNTVSCVEPLSRNSGNWTPEQDSILLRFIYEHGGGKWSKLCEELGGCKNAQQCKRRWDALTRLILQRKKIH